VVDELLAIPPERFVEARNAAARRLREEGRRDAAEAIKALSRPSVPLWALNRLAREQPSVIETFLRAADQLREAYRSGGDIRAATAPEREAEARVVAAAAELARAEGRNVTETVIDRLHETTRAAAADAESAVALREGRLLSEPRAPSIDELLGSMPQTSEAPTEMATQKRDQKAEKLALREQIAAAESEASQARSGAREASDATREAEREWKRAQKAAEQAQRRSEEAGARLHDLQERLGELR
jgi:hypothetical protein